MATRERHLEGVRHKARCAGEERDEGERRHPAAAREEHREAREQVEGGERDEGPAAAEPGQQHEATDDGAGDAAEDVRGIEHAHGPLRLVGGAPGARPERDRYREGVAHEQ